MADPAPQASKRSRLPLFVGAVVVLIAMGIGGFLFLTRDTSDPKLTIDDSASGSGTTVDIATLDGTWKVVPGSGDEATVAGYRVREVFAAGARKVTANGRTNDVTGSLTVAGAKVTAADITVDLTTLKSDEGRRDQVIRGDGLQTDQFPMGSFTLTEPIALPTITDGEVFKAQAKGELDLHGVRKAVTVPIDAKVTGRTVTLVGLVDLQLADYDIRPPSRPGFVEVADAGAFEFLVNLQR